ncbi:effector protein HopM1 [Pseudomonas flavescens]|uniref:Effector protein HopM1 n=1 Tax=Phytopseudomonas flavescens TaxID=29435 RepID=A0A1G8QA11_9GAMM|nr:hypothetical protein [Pseudomonas flavescens]SDJ01557.1 effector protein HopM1 [Pseudomonas flavescens]
MQPTPSTISRSHGSLSSTATVDAPSQRSQAMRSQARASCRAPLSAQQQAQVVQPSPTSLVRLFESQHPGLEAVRAEARQMILAQKPLNYSRPIGQQQRAAHRLAQNPLEINKRRMILEGRVLQMDPRLSYERMRALLNDGQPGQLDSGIPYGDTFARLLADIDQRFSQPMPAGMRVSGERLQVLLDNALPRIARHLDGQAALYGEVLADCELSDEERQQVQVGFDAFQALAGRWSTGIKERILDKCQALADACLVAARGEWQATQGLPPGPMRAQQVERAQAEVERWTQVKTQFDEASAGLQRSALQDSLDNMGLDRHLHELAEQGSGLFTSARVFLAASIPQGLSATLLFVLARAYVDPELSVLDLAGQAASSGAAVGAVHETLDNFVKPSAREVLASLGAPELRKVAAAEVIPNTPLATTDGGRYRAFTDDELQASMNDVERARKGFINAQQDYHNGTLKGDGITFGSQAGAQMVRRLIELTTSINASGIAARAASSFAGGAVMSGGQALGQQHKRFEYQGRSLPTHVPQAPPAESLGTRLGTLWGKALTSVDPRQSNSREAYTSKVYSASEGMSVYHGMGVLVARVGAGTVAAKAGSVLLTGVQALGLLAPFYANKQSRDEAELDDTTRFASAMQNIRDPDREVLPHGTRPNTLARRFENGYNRFRGLEQALPQAGVELTEGLTREGVKAASRLGGSLAGASLRHTPVVPRGAAPVDVERGEG